MSLSFGARLRSQRERRQVTLATIAEHTKIKASLLEGLERDDLSHWPGGIFRRSYVRAYAHAIGLDPEAVVREFLERHPDPVQDGSDALARSRSAIVAPGPSTRLGFLISSAIDALPELRGQSIPRSRALTDPGARTARTPAEAEARGGLGDPDRPVEPVRAAPVDLTAFAGTCTRLACAVDTSDVARALADAVGLFDAVGLMLWTWDPEAGALRPAIGHGYPDDLLARLPSVRPDEDNAIAWSFRSAETHAIAGSDLATAALTVPLMTATGCAGVLALELRNGDERRTWVSAAATILAAQLSVLVGQPPLARAATA